MGSYSCVGDESSRSSLDVGDHSCNMNGACLLSKTVGHCVELCPGDTDCGDDGCIALALGFGCLFAGGFQCGTADITTRVCHLTNCNTPKVTAA